MLLPDMSFTIVFPRKSLGGIRAILNRTVELRVLPDILMTARNMTVEIPKAIESTGRAIRDFASECTSMCFDMFAKPKKMISLFLKL